MKKFINIKMAALILFLVAGSISAQTVKLGPRLSGNLNIHNHTGTLGNTSGIGVGLGGTVDISFSKRFGIITNLTLFDMKNFSNENTRNRQTTEISSALSYLSIDPFFKAEFSRFYLLGGFSAAIKISSSVEQTVSGVGFTPQVSTLNVPANSIKFDLAAGTGYNFKLTKTMDLASDFIVYIPISKTYDLPGVSNSTLSLKLGASLKFKI